MDLSPDQRSGSAEDHRRALARPHLARAAGQATRPTAERLRQALFDMLLHAPWGGRLDGMAVLDAFAGTGALGLEALSRGAASAVFMERDRAALDVLRANIAGAAARWRRCLRRDVLRPPPGRPCALVFLDPPYGENLLPRALAALAQAGMGGARRAAGGGVGAGRRCRPWVRCWPSARMAPAASPSGGRLPLLKLSAPTFRHA